MIPYFQFTTVALGPLTIQVWGTFVALGILLGAWVSARFAQRHGLATQQIYSGASYLIIAAFIGARVVHVLFYEPGYYWANPWEILAFWHGGFSVMGGFLGALLGYLVFVKRQAIAWVPYADAFIYGLPAGMACGRIGCFLIHDHPGTATHFILGVQGRDGIARHDLGLYEGLQSLALALVFIWLARKPRPALFFVRVFLLWYGVVRFFLDFLRTADATYFGLTPAQYLCIGMIVGALWLQRLTSVKENGGL